MNGIGYAKSCFRQGLKQGIKQVLKEMLADRQRKKYGRILEKKTVTYDAWIRQMEKERADVREEERLPDTSVKEIPYEACRDYCLGKALRGEKSEVLVFTDSQGIISESAREEIGQYFSAHSGIKLLYGDEDVMSPEGIRYTPWFKPDWSPDTFLSFFYFGSIFAVRTQFLQELTVEEMKWAFGEEGRRGNEESKGIYRLCYLLAIKCGGFEKRAADEDWNFPIGHLDEILFHGKVNREMMLERMQG